MSRELVERLREEETVLARRSIERGCVDSGIAANLASEAADLIERQDILIKEMAATLQNMALSLSNEDTEE